ncbi:MAG TPA: GNAT family N-acetyltransferase [Usitatibacter sp.]|jgi:CelD/BcsL family acetyltransferase involved in cellulose biosynthesis|nr:GNAT family N-acetyltransferase [Usitatibacter sp.]
MAPDVVRRVEAWHGEPVLPDWWGPLFASVPDAAIFLSPWWMQSWLETYGARFRGDWVRWEHEGRVIAGVLVVRGIVRKALLPLRCIYLNATAEDSERPPLLEYNDILTLPPHRAAVAADFADLIAARGWECLVLAGYAKGSVLDDGTRALPAAFARRDERPAPYLDLALLGDAPYDKVLGGNTGSQVRRSVKLYEQRSGPLVLQRASGAADALSFLERMAPLHNRRWEAKGIQGSFANALRGDFHRRMVPRLAAAGTLDFLRVTAGDFELGYLYNFVHRGKAYSFQSGFAFEEDARFKPGLVCHRMAVEEYRRQGLREYDFLAGDARYKRSLANAERSLWWSTLYRDRAWLRALAWAWQARGRLARARASGRPA